MKFDIPPLREPHLVVEGSAYVFAGAHSGRGCRLPHGCWSHPLPLVMGHPLWGGLRWGVQGPPRDPPLSRCSRTLPPSEAGTRREDGREGEMDGGGGGRVRESTGREESRKER